MVKVLRAIGLVALVSWSVAIPARQSDPVSVADGVYAFLETPGEVAPENAGRVGNGGFIIGPTGITVIDTGVSFQHGLARLEAIRALSDKPIELVIITHAMQEFLFGNAAFSAVGTTFLTHEKSAELMRQRCAHCLENLKLILGEEVMAGSSLIVPTRLVRSSTTIVSGGRTLELIHPGWAATPGDLMVLDRATGTLFAGGVIVDQRIPEIRDGRLPGWIAAVDLVRRLAPSIVVPGHGPLTTAVGAERTADYLRALDRRVREIYEHGTSLLDAVDHAQLPAFAGWAGYPTIHRRNVLHHYLQLEVEDLAR